VNLDPAVIRRARRVLEPLARYHRFSAEGLENVPRVGPALLVVHHSFATYDGFLLGGAIYDATGRIPSALGDNRIFQVPGLAGAARALGLVPGSPEAGEQLLREGEILAVAPGGMWESLRPRGERRQSRWGTRRGFVRLALRAGVPIVVAACPAADAIYTLYPSHLTDRAYARWHWPVPVLRGVGPTLVPRPVRLTGYFAPPIAPPLYDPAREDEQVEALYSEAQRRMSDLLTRP